MTSHTAENQLTGPPGDFLETLSFDTVRFYNLAGLSQQRKVSSGEPGETAAPAGKSDAEDQEWRLHATISPGRIALHIRLDTRSPTSHFIVEAAVFFDREEGHTETPSHEVVSEFVRVLAYPALLPFLREALFDLARRLELPRPTLPVAGTPDELMDALSEAKVSNTAAEAF